MLKSAYAAGAAVVVFSTLAIAAPFATPDSSSSVPLLSGTYIIAEQTFCQESMVATEKSGAVSTIKVTGDDDGLSAGTVKFKQGSTTGAGTLSITQTTVGGTPLLASGSGTTGDAGDTLKESTGTIGTTFKQTATTFSFVDGSKTNSFKVYYGKVSSGVAQSAVFVGIDDKGCAQQGTLTIN
jgi:hypothetical protein